MVRKRRQAENGRLLERIDLDRSVVLVGLMGAGKSAIGKRLAARLFLPFRDSDDEIELAAGCTIPEIFSRYGESAFRDVERKVILRLLDEEPHILATGGGAFMDPAIRQAVAEKAISIWLKAPLSVLVERTAKRGNRPLLAGGDVREKLKSLMEIRNPVYGAADITVDSRNRPLEAMTESCLVALGAYLEGVRNQTHNPAPNQAGK
ncbi:shikimate kinase [Fodinicurvata sp. EGI_FJ10296]|uniref:shikimate kinase n=1 Tax=Fodinicurvata sp. EGI_FJ10296 TaxID=3231908 RepID=UPI003454EDF0